MRFAEVIYETGAKSVVSYENESELKNGLAEHHRRAVNGENAQEGMDRPAERITKVYLYDKHPVDLHNNRVSVDTIRELINGMADEQGTFDSDQLISALRDEVSPVLPLDQGRHASIFKADATGELDLAFLNPPAASKDGE